MTDMQTGRPLDKALDFNSENLFEYMEFLLHNMNAGIISEQSGETIKKLFRYIKTLDVPNADEVIFEVEDMANEALCHASHYAFKAGFMEACRLIRTLQSF